MNIFLKLCLKTLLLIVFMVSANGAAFAQEKNDGKNDGKNGAFAPDDTFADGTFQGDKAPMESLARDIGRSLRCVVCQNQSIEDSDAPLASDMRKLVRRQLQDGKSKAEIIAYMRQTYGDYVLLKPPVQSNTYILWFGPFLILILALLWFLRRAIPSSDASEKHTASRLADTIEDIGK